MDRPSADRPPEPVTAAGMLGEGLAARIDRWAAEARVDEAARRRAREHWLRHQAEEEASLSGVLTDVAERRTPVILHVRGGRQHRGDVRAVGRDFVALRSGATETIVALDAVVSVQTRPGEAPAIGDRPITTALRLSDVLAELAGERSPALLVMADGDEAVAGIVRSVGTDVVVVRLAGDAPGTAYVPLGAITEVVLG
ncbi:MAG TPA: hypothetical protein VE623_19735 [Acidimicrobiales bacterium]|nr:hypothetical protein [Acidimicrobiales bacterium]